MAHHLNLVARNYKTTMSSTKKQWQCGDHIQGVTTVMTDNIIEQVTDFKYSGYCVSEYKTDFEDKLRTHNKINGAIRRQLENEQRKLRIRNITAKGALKFGSEAWVMKRGRTF